MDELYIQSLKESAIRHFGTKPGNINMFFAPGRINIIGEHTDYNLGYVLPCAISQGTYLAIALNERDTFRLASSNFPSTAEIGQQSLNDPSVSEWIRYPLGIIREFMLKDIAVPGMDLYFSGNIPNGAGLSSSASIEMVTAMALNELTNAGISMFDLVLMAKHAENTFVGVNCGIMDMFAVGYGKSNSAMLIDCRSNEFRIIPFNPSGCKLLISDTRKVRGLADSKYNERVAECNAAIEDLRKFIPIESLRDMNPSLLQKYADIFRSDHVYRRVRHVVTENKRVEDAVSFLATGNLEGLGILMNASHDSLRDDYEVTGRELDILVDETRKVPGVLGSRMTGAGFGGCTVSLVKEEVIEELCRHVEKVYSAQTGLKPAFYIAEPGDGVCRIPLLLS